ncbi:unnamed protein product [Dracunculus medinensis]|uniref:dolichyl-diphosphooligosaccharide--protein glycotransferase n=1 Tax=Dracunculus medinensis TaxID=318479 RepID=A0A3P7QHZ4_DRAME|nr:unnamed protein product [Dracunculus medinensis]VDN54377.1 unnamed protein product [Dracunculus medinensis]
MCQIMGIDLWLRSSLPDNIYNKYRYECIINLIGIGVFTLFALISLERIAPWSGRFYAFLDPSYASKSNPLIACVGEHHPTAWSFFYSNFQMILIAIPGCHGKAYTDFNTSKLHALRDCIFVTADNLYQKS